MVWAILCSPLGVWVWAHGVGHPVLPSGCLGPRAHGVGHPVLPSGCLGLGPWCGPSCAPLWVSGAQGPWCGPSCAPLWVSGFGPMVWAILCSPLGVWVWAHGVGHP